MDLAVALAAGREVVRRGLEAMLAALDGVSWRSYRTAEEIVVGAVATGWAQVSLVEGGDLRRLGPHARHVPGLRRVVSGVFCGPSQPPAAVFFVRRELSPDSLGGALHDVASGPRHLPEPI